MEGASNFDGLLHRFRTPHRCFLTVKNRLKMNFNEEFKIGHREHAFKSTESFIINTGLMVVPVHTCALVHIRSSLRCGLLAERFPAVA
jgi:hypothetical protein